MAWLCTYRPPTRQNSDISEADSWIVQLDELLFIKTNWAHASQSLFLSTWVFEFHQKLFWGPKKFWVPNNICGQTLIDSCVIKILSLSWLDFSFLELTWINLCWWHKSTLHYLICLESFHPKSTYPDKTTLTHLVLTWPVLTWPSLTSLNWNKNLRSHTINEKDRIC